MTARTTGPDASAPDTERPVGFRRDASAWNRPDTTTSKRIHFDRGDGTARCSQVALDGDKPVDLLGLPHDDHLCRRCFPRAGLGQPLSFVVLGDRIDSLMGDGYVDSVLARRSERTDS